MVNAAARAALPPRVRRAKGSRNVVPHVVALGMGTG